MRLPWQVVVAVTLHDPALLASLRDRQLRGAFGTLGEGHDLLAELVVACFSCESRQRLGDVRFFHASYLSFIKDER